MRLQVIDRFVRAGVKCLMRIRVTNRYNMLMEAIREAGVTDRRSCAAWVDTENKEAKTGTYFLNNFLRFDIKYFDFERNVYVSISKFVQQIKHVQTKGLRRRRRRIARRQKSRLHLVRTSTQKQQKMKMGMKKKKLRVIRLSEPSENCTTPHPHSSQNIFWEKTNFIF